ncbi:MAG: sulfatase, partial [Gammaproteobacteria bacterium]|nr:sulfatase [Gammaproteobacteria bacterium]
AYGGHPQTRTPNIDRLASRGVTFLNAQTQSPACNPSRGALLSGITPASSNLTGSGEADTWRYFPRLRFAKTLPQHFKESGYVIKLSGKVFHHNPDLVDSWPSWPATEDKGHTDWDSVYNNDQGRDVGTPLFNPKASRPPETVLPATIYGNGYGDLPFAWGPIVPLNSNGKETRSPAQLERVREGMSDFKVARWAASQVANYDPAGGKPLFLAAGIHRPHLSWNVPVQYFNKFDPSQISLPLADRDDWFDIPRIGRVLAGDNAPDWLSRDMRQMLASTPGSNLSWSEAVRAYLAAINFADDAVGVMLKAIEARVASHAGEPWVVVLWSDHGWHLGEKMHWRKFTLWEEATRSPLIFWLPNQPGQGTRVEVPVSLGDIYPSLAELAGLPVPMHVQGDSIVDLIQNPSARADGFAVTTFGEGRHAVRSKRWRYIRYEDGTEDLYDHASDPKEWTNLLFDPTSAAAHRQTADALSTELYRWSVKVNNTAISSPITVGGVATKKFALETVPNLGVKQVDRFDGKSGNLDVDPKWSTVKRGGAGGLYDFTFSNGAVLAPLGLRALARADSVAVNANFIASVGVTLPGDSRGAGILFGYRNNGNFFEFQVMNGNSKNGSPYVDVRLVQLKEGKESILQTADLPQISEGTHTVVVDYTAEKRQLELIVMDPGGVNWFRGSYTLSEPLPVGSGLGLTSTYSKGVTFDNFTALSYQPVQLVGY